MLFKMRLQAIVAAAFIVAVAALVTRTAASPPYVRRRTQLALDEIERVADSNTATALVLSGRVSPDGSARARPHALLQADLVPPGLPSDGELRDHTYYRCASGAYLAGVQCGTRKNGGDISAGLDSELHHQPIPEALLERCERLRDSFHLLSAAGRRAVAQVERCVSDKVEAMIDEGDIEGEMSSVGEEETIVEENAARTLCERRTWGEYARFWKRCSKADWKALSSADVEVLEKQVFVPSDAGFVEIPTGRRVGQLDRPRRSAVQGQFVLD